MMGLSTAGAAPTQRAGDGALATDAEVALQSPPENPRGGYIPPRHARHVTPGAPVLAPAVASQGRPPRSYGSGQLIARTLYVHCDPDSAQPRAPAPHSDAANHPAPPGIPDALPALRPRSHPSLLPSPMSSLSLLGLASHRRPRAVCERTLALPCRATCPPGAAEPARDAVARCLSPPRAGDRLSWLPQTAPQGHAPRPPHARTRGDRPSAAGSPPPVRAPPTPPRARRWAKFQTPCRTGFARPDWRACSPQAHANLIPRCPGFTSRAFAIL